MKKNSGKGSFVVPRNGHVAAVMTKGGAGAHGKTKKAQRRSDKIAFLKKVQEVHLAGEVLAIQMSPLTADGLMMRPAP